MQISKSAFVLAALAVMGSTISSTLAQERMHTGRPLWQSFDTRDTGGAMISRQAHVDDIGFAYAANDAGLLTFDGVRWQVFRAGSQGTPLHALAPLSDGVWITGGPGVLGLFNPDPVSGFAWQSLIDNAEDDSEAAFDTITKFHVNHGHILILTGRSVVKLQENEFIEVLSDAPTGFSFRMGTETYVETAQGLFRIGDNSPILIETPPGWEDFEPITVLQGDDNSIVLVTRRSGLFRLIIDDSTLQFEPLWTSLPAPLASVRVSAAFVLSDGSYVLGSESGTLLHILKDGGVVLNLNKAAGFRAGTIRSLAGLPDGSVMAFHDGGAIWIEPQSAIRVWNFANGLTAPPRSAATDGVTTYVGTDDGLFRTLTGHRAIAEPRAGTNPIHLVSIYTRSTVRGHVSLLLGRDDGLFDFYQERMTPLSSKSPTAIQISSTQPSRIAVSSTEGISLFSFSEGGWINSGNLFTTGDEGIVGLSESSEGHLAAIGDAGTIWTFATDQWLADSIDKPALPLTRQETARRFGTEQQPIFSSASDPLRVFLGEAPLIWTPEQERFLVDVPLSLGLSTLAGPYLAAATDNQYQWLQTPRGVYAIDRRNPQYPIQVIPRLAAGTAIHRGFAADPANGRLLVISPQGLVEQKLKATVNQTSAASLPSLLIRSIQIGGETVAQSLSGIDRIETPTSSRTFTLSFSVPEYDFRCSESDVRISGADRNSDVQLLPLSSTCQITLPTPYDGSGVQTLKFGVVSEGAPVTKPAHLIVRHSLAWYSLIWTPLAVTLISTVAALYLLTSVKSDIVKWAAEPIAMAAALGLLWVVGLSSGVLHPAQSFESLTLQVGLLTLAALALPLLTRVIVASARTLPLTGGRDIKS